MADQAELTIYLRRYPRGANDSTEYQEFKVPKTEGMSVLETLRYIQETTDSSLAFDYSCRIGVCRGCAVRIDGKVAMACSTPAADRMQIEAVNPRLTRRDLISRPSAYPCDIEEVRRRARRLEVRDRKGGK